MDSDLPRDCHRYFIEEIIELPHPQAILAKRLLNLIGRISGLTNCHILGLVGIQLVRAECVRCP